MVPDRLARAARRPGVPCVSRLAACAGEGMKALRDLPWLARSWSLADRRVRASVRVRRVALFRRVHRSCGMRRTRARGRRDRADALVIPRTRAATHARSRSRWSSLPRASALPLYWQQQARACRRSTTSRRIRRSAGVRRHRSACAPDRRSRPTTRERVLPMRSARLSGHQTDRDGEAGRCGVRRRAGRGARPRLADRRFAIAATGRIEATATTAWFGFRDDVVIRVAPRGAGSRVDLRSLSRIGRGDLGANARRIREFSARLQS